MSTPEQQSPVENLKAKLARKQSVKHSAVTDDGNYHQQTDHHSTEHHSTEHHSTEHHLTDQLLSDDDMFVNDEPEISNEDDVSQHPKIASNRLSRAFKRNSEYEIAELLSQRFWGINVFLIVMLSLAIAILWTGVATATQIQQYREDYKQLQNMKQEYRQLQVEHKRLLIEQQTFSATAKIASRALGELNMFFPTFQDKLILQPIANTNTTDNTDNTVNQATHQTINQITSQHQPVIENRTTSTRHEVSQ